MHRDLSGRHSAEARPRVEIHNPPPSPPNPFSLHRDLSGGRFVLKRALEESRSPQRRLAELHLDAEAAAISSAVADAFTAKYGRRCAGRVSYVAGGCCCSHCCAAAAAAAGGGCLRLLRHRGMRVTTTQRLTVGIGIQMQLWRSTMHREPQMPRCCLLMLTQAVHAPGPAVQRVWPSWTIPAAPAARRPS